MGPQHVVHVLPALKGWIEDDAVKPALEVLWIQLIEVSADKVNIARALIFHSQDIEKKAVDFAIGDFRQRVALQSGINEGPCSGRWFENTGRIFKAGELDQFFCHRWWCGEKSRYSHQHRFPGEAEHLVGCRLDTISVLVESEDCAAAGCVEEGSFDGTFACQGS